MNYKIAIAIAFLCQSFVRFSQKEFIPQSDLKTLKSWVREAKSNNEIDKKSIDRIYEIHNDLAAGSDDANHVYNLGRAIAKALQPSFSIQNHTFSNGAIKLLVQAELAYRFAINNCKCHGRANVMLGMLYNQQKKYFISEPYLEKGLQLEEGSVDWMIAANQYALAGVYTYKTTDDKYIAVFKKLKKYAFKTKHAYYTKMVNLYQAYYEKP